MSDAEPLRLARDGPPAPDPGSDPPRWAVAPGVWIVADTPRRIEPPTVSAAALLEAIDTAATRLFGQGSRAAVERAAGLRRGSIGQWVRREQIPPPGVVAWLAWAASHPRPAELGHAIRLRLEAGEAAHDRLDEAARVYLAPGVL